MLEFSNYLFEMVVCVALAAAGIGIYLQRAELIRLRRLIRCEHEDRQSLDKDVAALLACSRNIGERVRSQDARQNTMLKKLDIIDLHSDSSGRQSYEQVRRMVEQGMGIDEIAEICDLRRGEVDLLNHIASHRSAA